MFGFVNREKQRGREKAQVTNKRHAVTAKRPRGADNANIPRKKKTSKAEEKQTTVGVVAPVTKKPESPTETSPFVGDVQMSDIKHMQTCLSSLVLQRVDSFASRQSDTDTSDSDSDSGNAAGSRSTSPRKSNVSRRQALSKIRSILRMIHSSTRVYHETQLQLIDRHAPPLIQPEFHSIQSVLSMLNTVEVPSGVECNYAYYGMLSTRPCWVVWRPRQRCKQPLRSVLEGFPSESTCCIVYNTESNTSSVMRVDIPITKLKMAENNIALVFVHDKAIDTPQKRVARACLPTEKDTLRDFTRGKLSQMYLTDSRHKVDFKQISASGLESVIRHILAGTHGARINEPLTLVKATEMLLQECPGTANLELHECNLAAFVAARRSSVSNIDSDALQLCRCKMSEDGSVELYGTGRAVAAWTAANVIKLVWKTIRFVKDGDPPGVLFLGVGAEFTAKTPQKKEKRA